MCHDSGAIPPDPPRHQAGESGQPVAGVLTPGGLASAEDITLTSRDGTRFAAHAARPQQPNGAGVVILPDIRGLFPFYKALAQRFAEAGVESVAIDYFGRTAGIAARGDDFDSAPHVELTRPQQVAEDIAAAITLLRTRPNPAPRAIFTLGFCFGGVNSLLQAANRQGLAGVIAFYGWPAENRRHGPSPLARVSEFACPVLGLYGAEDTGIPVKDVKQFEDALEQAGVEHQIVIYPGTPHSFFDRRYTEYHEQSADAWRRVLGFIAAHTPRTVA